MPTVILPLGLNHFNPNQKQIVSGNTVLEAITNLVNDWPAAKPYLLQGKNKLTTFVNFYLNETDIRMLEGENTPIQELDILKIIPALAGG